MLVHAATRVEKNCCPAENADMLHIATENANAWIGNDIKKTAGYVVI